MLGAQRSLEIAARVRVELPRYRLRGTCGIFWSPDGFLQVDFDHSSLFGSYREEATITVTDGRLTIQDHRRGTILEEPETVELLAEQFGLEVRGDDLVYLLLLLPLRLDESGPVMVEKRGDGMLTVRGRWRGRDVEISGHRGEGVRRLRMCGPGGVCYDTRYAYAPGGEPTRYPQRIVCERHGDGRRISLTIESVRRVGPDGAAKKDLEREPALAQGVSPGEGR